MRKLGKNRFAVLLYLVLLTAPCTAHIISLKLRSDNQHIIPISDFEFSNAGYVSLVFSSVTFTSNSPQFDPSRIGFFLQSREVEFYFQTRELRNQETVEFLQNTSCALDYKLHSVLFTFQNLSHDPGTTFNTSCPVTNPGIKSLYLVNCNNESESLVTIDGRIELYNIDTGTIKNYLSPRLKQLPLIYVIFSFIYLTFLGVWILVLCFKNRRCYNRTHLLMGLLLLLNFVYLMCVAADLHYVKVTGTAHGLDVLFYILQLMRAVLLSTVIVLIGAGWFFWKPFLEGQDKLVLIIGIPLEVWANLDPIFPWVAAIAFENFEWLADLVCCLFFFCPILGSRTWLEDNCEDDHLNASRNVRKMWLFGTLVFIYVYVRMIVVPEMCIRWGNYVLKETDILVFCMLMFYMFRPVDRMRMMLTRNQESQLSTSNSIYCLYSPV